MKPPILFLVTRRMAVPFLGELNSAAWGTLWYCDPAKAVEASEVPFAVTLEKSYQELGGAPKVPDGLWYCSAREYFKGGYLTFEIHVPDHDHIMFHKGNWVEDTEGCPLIAEQFHDFDPRPGIQDPGIGNSRGGFEEFMQLAGGHSSFFTEFRTTG